MRNGVIVQDVGPPQKQNLQCCTMKSIKLEMQVHENSVGLE